MLNNLALAVILNSLETLVGNYLEEDEEDEPEDEIEDEGTKQLYSLRDPASPGVVFYIGQTSNTERRLREHIHKAMKIDPRDVVIRDMCNNGRTPVMVVEDGKFTTEEANQLEKGMIEEFVRLGHPICNLIHNPRLKRSGERR